MSDLNAQVSAWRRAVGQQMDSRSADELEDHLRTTIDGLAPTGLSEEERLLIASHRLGHPDALSAEFAKIDPFAVWRDRLAWMLVGLVPLHLMLGAVSNVGVRLGSVTVLWDFPLWGTALVELALRAIFLVGILAACFWAGRTSRPVAWQPARWMPVRFAPLAAMLVMIVMVFYSEPLILRGFDGWAGSSRIGFHGVQQLMYDYQFARSFLDPAFYAASAVLIAWLIASRRAKSDATMTHET